MLRVWHITECTVNMKWRDQHPPLKPVGKTQQDDLQKHIGQLYGTPYMVGIRKNLVRPYLREGLKKEGRSLYLEHIRLL